MKKRTRKKRKLGEYKELGYMFKGDFKETTDEIRNKFLDDLILLCESMQLSCGGGFDVKNFEFVIDKHVKQRKYRVNPSKKDVESIKNFMENSSIVLNLSVSEPFDLWHDNWSEVL